MRDAIELALAGLLFGFKAKGFNLLFQFADAADGFALFGPARAKGGDLLSQRGGVALDNLAAFDAVGVGLALESFAFDFERGLLALELIDLGGHGADLNGERGGGFVDQVDGLVGQEAVADVAMRERGRGHNGGVLDAHVVVRFVAILEPAQNRDSVFNVGLADVDDLETALEGGVLLDVLAVFIQRGCADGTQFAARQGGLEHVAGVDGALGSACADQRVQLVDEENDFAVRFFDLLEHGLEAVFKLAAIFCAGEHGAEVKRDDALVAQALGHVAGDDAAGEAFDDGGFAHAGFANEDGVVLGAAAQDLNDAADLFVAADDGVELAAAREFGQVLGVFFQGLELAFGILIGNALRAAHGGQRFQDGVVRCAEAVERVARRIVFKIGGGEQQVLGGDVFVFEVRGFLECLVEDAGERLARHWAARPPPRHEEVFPRWRAVRVRAVRWGRRFFQAQRG